MSFRRPGFLRLPHLPGCTPWHHINKLRALGPGGGERWQAEHLGPDTPKPLLRDKDKVLICSTHRHQTGNNSHLPLEARRPTGSRNSCPAAQGCCSPPRNDLCEISRLGQKSNRSSLTGLQWFQIGKGVHQGCISSPCLFNFYAEYIMRNAGLEEAQAGIKIAGRNVITSDMQVTPPLWQKVRKN